MIKKTIKEMKKEEQKREKGKKQRKSFRIYKNDLKRIKIKLSK